MKERITKLELALLDLQKEVDELSLINEVKKDKTKLLTQVINDSNSIYTNIKERFELIDLKLSNKDKEIEILNIQIGNLETKNEILEMKLSSL